MDKDWRKASLGQRWSEARPTKTIVFWLGVGAVLATVITGFTWGGWVRGSTAQAMVEDAVVSRLAPICVAQSKSDPRQEQKLQEWKAISTWERGDYVKKQGWATMPGEGKSDGRVADECAKLLGQAG